MSAPIRPCVVDQGAPPVVQICYPEPVADRRTPLIAGAFLLLAGCPAASESGGGAPSTGFPSGIQNCTPFTLDAGAVGSALQLLPQAVADEAEWRPGLSLVGIIGIAAPDGTDPQGSWTYKFGSPSLAGTGFVTILPNRTFVTGACHEPPKTPAIANWKIDSPAALTLAMDAGCKVGLVSTMQLYGIKDPASPLNGIDPAWNISSSDDAGISTCAIDATTGAFGIPDAGTAGSASGDGG